MTDIRKAVDADIEHIMEIEREAIKPPWPESAVMRELEREETVFIVALDGDAIEGFAMLRDISGEAELFQIAVRAERRGQGIGSALLGRVMELAAARGVYSTFLEVRESNTAARHLYEKHAFAEVGLRKGYYTEPKEDAVIMKCEMGSQGADTGN